MDIGYIIKGKIEGENWKSRVFEDAEECEQIFYDLLNSGWYYDLKKYTVYMHYEGWD